MFDLDTAIESWSASVQAQRCNRDASITELSDHLHSEVERLTAEGLSERQAFGVATDKIGEPAALDAEFDKNRSLMSRVGRKLHAFDDSLSGGPRRAHAFLGGTFVLAAAIVLTRLDATEAAAYLLVVFVPLWFASGELLNRG